MLKKIGQGLQFNVYDFGTKIRKIKTSPDQIREKLLAWHPVYYRFKRATLEKDVNKIILERENVISELKRRKIDPAFFANLKINKIIEQDKVIPLKDQLQDINEVTLTTKKYIQFILSCWKQGFSERTFNITINYGSYPNGKITLIDFGELNFNKEEVRKDISTRKWEKSWSYKKDLPIKLKKQYKITMRNNLTFSQLNKIWQQH